MIINIGIGRMIVWESARMEEQILQIIKDEDSKNPLTDEEIASRLQGGCDHGAPEAPYT